VIFQDTLERDFGSDPDLLAPGRAHPAPRGRTPPRLQRARGRRARLLRLTGLRRDAAWELGCGA
jgi:hypothetical protein